LGSQPYLRVYELIAKLHQQAQVQLQQEPASSFRVTEEEEIVQAGLNGH